MINETYSEMVTRLKKPGAEVLADMDAFKADVMHLTLGIMGELGELYSAIGSGERDNIVLELGDLEFYLEAMRQLLRMSEEVIRSSTASPSHYELVEVVKKHVINGKPLNGVVICSVMRSMHVYMESIRNTIGVTRSHVLSLNKEKLDSRFTSGEYSNYQALERSDEK